jgi:hypothetical protein
MRRKRPDPLLAIILFVGIGLIITAISMEFRTAGSAAAASAQLLADDESRTAR